MSQPQTANETERSLLHLVSKQHVFILESINIIESAVREKDDNKYFDNFKHFNSLLEEHLLLEDEYLYPTLQNRPELDAALLGTKYHDEMAGLGEALGEYSEKWDTAAALQADRDKFIDDTINLCGVIKERIEREENNLFPLLTP